MPEVTFGLGKPTAKNSRLTPSKELRDRIILDLLNHRDGRKIKYFSVRVSTDLDAALEQYARACGSDKTNLAAWLLLSFAKDQGLIT
jgi:hypothetical protein